jgi:hypothetical protein
MFTNAQGVDLLVNGGARIFSRVSAVYDYEAAIRHATGTLLGCGCVGSACALALLRSGMPVNAVDSDVSEIHNVANQLLPPPVAGTLPEKVYGVERLASALGALGRVNPLHYRLRDYLRGFRFGHGHQLLVCSFDNMTARREAWRMMEASASGLERVWHALYVDFRVDLTSYTCYVVPFVYEDHPARGLCEKIAADYALTLHDELQPDAAEVGFQFQGCERQVSLTVPLMCAAYLSRMLRALFFCGEEGGEDEPKLTRYKISHHVDTFGFTDVPFAAFSTDRVEVEALERLRFSSPEAVEG